VDSRLGGEVQDGSNSSILDGGGSAQLIVLRLDGLLGIHCILVGPVLHKVNLGLVVVVVADGIQLVAEIPDVSLLVQDIDGGLLLTSLLGQSHGSVLQASVLGSLDEDHAESPVQGAGNLLGASWFVEVSFVGGVGEELLLELSLGSHIAGGHGSRRSSFRGSSGHIGLGRGILASSHRRSGVTGSRRSKGCGNGSRSCRLVVVATPGTHGSNKAKGLKKDSKKDSF